MSARQSRTQDPYSLTAEMLGSAPVVTARRPYRVLAWIPYPDGQRQIRAEATAWNDRAVRLRWVDGIGAQREAWVWIGAVAREPEDPRERAPLAYQPPAR